MFRGNCVSMIYNESFTPLNYGLYKHYYSLKRTFKNNTIQNITNLETSIIYHWDTITPEQNYVYLLSYVLCFNSFPIIKMITKCLYTDYLPTTYVLWPTTIFVSVWIYLKRYSWLQWAASGGWGTMERQIQLILKVFQLLWF